MPAKLEDKSAEDWPDYSITWRRNDGIEFTFFFEPEEDLRKPTLDGTVSSVINGITRKSADILQGGKIIGIDEIPADIEYDDNID